MHGICMILISLASAGLAIAQEQTSENIDLVVAQFGQSWFGPDGPWATVEVEVGTPGQKVYLTVATLQDTILPITPGACTGERKCIEGRGSAFETSESSTWSPSSDRDVEIDAELVSGISLNGQAYGMEISGMPGADTVSIGGLPGIKGVAVGAVKSARINNGLLGLRNLTLELFEQRMIPSPSWAYYTGYGDSKRSPQLVFGGYDQTKYLPGSTQNFTLAKSTDGRPIMNLMLNRLFLDTTGSPDPHDRRSNIEYIGRPIRVVVDSTTPFSWLPRDIADGIAKSVGAYWNDSIGTSGYYVYNTSSPAYANLQNCTLAFQFNGTEEAWFFNSMTVSQSLLLESPLDGVGKGNKIPYLPLRPVDDGSNFVLGRSFLQQIYLTANYHTMRFSLSQYNLESNAAAKYVRIEAPLPPLPPSPISTNIAQPSLSTQRLSDGAIAGLVIGLFAAMTFVLGGFFYYSRINRKTRRLTMPVPPDPDKVYPKNGILYREMSADSISSQTAMVPSQEICTPIDTEICQSPVEMPTDEKSILEKELKEEEPKS